MFPFIYRQNIRTGLGNLAIAPSAFIIILFLASCTFQKRAIETPVPNSPEILQVRRDFFFDKEGRQKTFLCGWASELERGQASRVVTHLFNNSMHCNIRFRVQKNKLVGDIINPSYVENPDKWIKNAIEFNVDRHYYLEHPKDTYGREDKSKLVKISDRSQAEFRDYMDVNLKSMRLNGWAYSLLRTQNNSAQIKSISKKEFVPSQGFLGFSADIMHPAFGADVQARFRFNFLEYKNNPKLNDNITKLKASSSQHFKLVFKFAKSYEGLGTELYAGKWDLSRQHKIYLKDVPEDQRENVKAAYRLWNEVFTTAGVSDSEFNAPYPQVQKALNENPSYSAANFPFYVTDEPYPSEHNFDLRYSSFIWIHDEEVADSPTAPIAMANSSADVLNGEFKWGSVTFFGGGLKRKLKSQLPLVSLSGEGGNVYLSRLYRYNENFNFLKAYGRLKTPEVRQKDYISKWNQNILASDFKPYGSTNFLEAQESVENYFSQHTLTEILNGRNLFKNTEPLPSMPKLERFDVLNKPLVEPSFSGISYQSFFRTINDTLYSIDQAFDAEVVQTSLHEVGHFLGFGHQFKGNVMPDKDKVPLSIYNALKENSKSDIDNKVYSKNMSTVMDYYPPYLTVTMNKSEFKPGPHDHLVAQYLYNKKYAVYDPIKDKYEFIPINKSAEIPIKNTNKSDSNTNNPLAYFPSCTDYEKNFYISYDCNVHDIGAYPSDIAETYMNQLRDLKSYFYNPGQLSQIPGPRLESWIWRHSTEQFARLRLFFDEMLNLIKETRFSSDGNLDDKDKLFYKMLNNTQAMLEFSECDPESNNEYLKEVFAHEKILRLCQANKKIVKFVKDEILSTEAQDFTKYDRNQSYYSEYVFGNAGRIPYSFLGTWSELSNLTLKIPALSFLTSSQAYGSIPGGGLFTLGHFSGGGKYSTFYYKYFTESITEVISQNLEFAGIRNKRSTHMGRLIPTLGYLLRHNLSTGKGMNYNQYLFDKLNSQYGFEFKAIYVLIEFNEKEAGVDYYNKISAIIYDPDTREETPVDNIYIRPSGEVLVTASNMYLYPASKMRFTSQNTALVYTYRIIPPYFYQDPEVDHTAVNGVQDYLNSVSKEMVDNCISGPMGGEKYGLSSYFLANPSEDVEANRDDFSCEDTAADKKIEFAGYYIPKEIMTSRDGSALGEFYTSVAKEESKFQCQLKRKATTQGHQNIIQNVKDSCSNFNKSAGQIVSTAALMNRMWLDIITNTLRDEF